MNRLERWMVSPGGQVAAGVLTALVLLAFLVFVGLLIGWWAFA